MQNKKLNQDDVAFLILIFSILFGTWLRLFPAWLAGFPINDGGMFYTMIQDLQSNQYRLPAYTSYNNSNIPFVYPPLGFYLGAIITDGLRLNTPLPVIQWLPGILNSISIFAFYLFAKEITQNKLQSAISTLAFSLTPHMTAWFSMGGGLTRSLGVIFMLLALLYIHHVIVNESKKDIWAAILFSGLTTLSHIESPIYTIGFAIYVWVMKSRSPKGIINGLLIASGVFLFISPWLFSILNNHGWAPFLSARQTGLYSPLSFLRILNVDFITEEPYLDLFGVLGILGIAVLVSRKNFFIPCLFLITFIFFPRSAHTLGNIPLAIASGFLIAQGLIPTMINSQSTFDEKSKTPILLFVLVITPFILGNSLYYSISLSKESVPEEIKNAMQWIKENTPTESTFLVITGETNGFCDSTSEWFPALTNRRSLATLQGNEWIQRNSFGKFIKSTQALQTCLQTDIHCILKESRGFEKKFDYIFIQLSPTTVGCNLTDASIPASNWMRDLEQFPQLQIAYTSDQVILLENH